jgi:hypothetical protein
MLQIVPLTADPTKPHAAVSAMAFALLVVGAGYAFYTSKAGEGLFKRLMPA